MWNLVSVALAWARELDRSTEFHSRGPRFTTQATEHVRIVFFIAGRSRLALLRLK